MRALIGRNGGNIVIQPVKLINALGGGQEQVLIIKFVDTNNIQLESSGNGVINNGIDFLLLSFQFKKARVGRKVSLSVLSFK